MVTRRNVIVTMAARVTSMTRVKTEALVRPMSVLPLGTHTHTHTRTRKRPDLPSPQRENFSIRQVAVLELGSIFTVILSGLRCLFWPVLCTC